MSKPTFEADAESFQLLMNHVKIGEICELKPEDASLLAPHIAKSPNTFYVASSGVPLSNVSGELTLPTRNVAVAIEWIRVEPNPNLAKEEPELNTNRFIFEYDGVKCIGYEATWKQKTEPQNGQVIKHWISLEGLIEAVADYKIHEHKPPKPTV